MPFVEIIGLSSVVFGLLNILAWRFVALRSIVGSTPYGGSLVFLSTGLALIALKRRYHRSAFGFALFSILFTLLRFFEFHSHTEFIAMPLLKFFGLPPGLVAAVSTNGVTCFVLYGIGIMLMCARGSMRWRPVVIALVGTISLVLSVFAISTYFVAVPEIPGIGPLNTTFLPRDIGYLVLSFAMLGIARDEMRRTKAFAPLWIAIPIATSGLMVTLLTWEALRRTVGSQHWVPLGFVLYGGSAMVIIVALLSASVQTTRRRTRELEESYGLIHSVIDSSTDGIFVKDDQGRFLMVNQAGARMLGCSPEELIGRFGRDFASATGADDLPSVDATVRQSGRAITYERELTTNGIGRAYLVTKAPYRNIDGEVIGVLAVARDITERKSSEARLRESEEKFRRIFDEASIGMVLTEHESRRIARVNRAFLELVDYSHDELATIGLAGVTFPEDRMESAQLTADVRAGRLLSARVEKRYVRRDGSVVWGEVRFMTIRNRREEPTYLLAMVVDVTARRAAEATLKAFNERLESRVAERTAALLASREALQRLAGDLTRSNDELQHFAHIASHDLQEPLRMISSYLTLLERRTAGKLDLEQVDFIRFAVDGAKRMKLLIDDLLRFSRVGTRTGDFGIVDTDEVLESALANLKFAIADAGGKLTIGELPRLRGDAVQLTQLFQNLIGNALKFRRGATAVIDISAQRDGDYWRFEVRDHGVGFEMQYADRIFEIFQRLHSREEYPGTGVGLAICKKIVERHGGRIWARSPESGGAVFTFLMPIPPPAELELIAQAGNLPQHHEKSDAARLEEIQAPRDIGN